MTSPRIAKRKCETNVAFGFICKKDKRKDEGQRDTWPWVRWGGRKKTWGERKHEDYMLAWESYRETSKMVYSETAKRCTEMRLSRGDRSCVIKTDTTAFPRREFSNSPGAALLRTEESNTNFLPSHNNLRVIGLSPMAACDWKKDF